MTEEGASPLMLACHSNNVDTVRLLLNTGASTKDIDKNGRTALHYSIENTSISCAESLLGEDESLLNHPDNSGLTSLHLATIAGNVVIVQYLINCGANIFITDNEKHSAAHWATVCSHLEILELLLHHKASLSSADINGAYPVHYAAQMCGENKSKESIHILKKILSKGVPVDCADSEQRQPLLWAASAGSCEACQLLISAGSKPDACDSDGLTALHCAASHGHASTIETLVLQCNLDVDSVDKNNCTPLFYAITMNHLDSVQILLDLGASCNHQDRKGRSPSHCAASKGNLKALTLLKEAGGNLWIKNHSGEFPIHEAVHGKHNDTVTSLIKMSPRQINAGNKNGRTCLHIAAMTSNLPLCRLLIDNSANINVVMETKNEYLTPYDVATMRGHRDCANYLHSQGGTSAGRVTTRAAKTIQKYTKKHLHKKNGQAPGSLEIISPGMLNSKGSKTHNSEKSPRPKSARSKPQSILPRRSVSPKHNIKSSIPEKNEKCFITEISPRVDDSNENDNSQYNTQSRYRKPKGKSSIISEVQKSVLMYEIPKQLARDLKHLKRIQMHAPRQYQNAVLHQLDEKEKNSTLSNETESIEDIDRFIEDELSQIGSQDQQNQSFLRFEIEKKRAQTEREVKQAKTELQKTSVHVQKQTKKYQDAQVAYNTRQDTQIEKLIQKTEKLFRSFNEDASVTLRNMKDMNNNLEKSFPYCRHQGQARYRQTTVSEQTQENIRQQERFQNQQKQGKQDYKHQKAKEHRNQVGFAYGQCSSKYMDSRRDLTTNSKDSTVGNSEHFQKSRPQTAVSMRSNGNVSPAQYRYLVSSSYSVMTDKGMLKIRDDTPSNRSLTPAYDGEEIRRQRLMFVEPRTYKMKQRQNKQRLQKIYGENLA